MQRFFFNKLIGLFAISVILITGCATPGHYNQKREGQAFIQQMVSRYGLNPNEVSSLLAQAQYRQDIIQKMIRPHEALPWFSYQRLFITPKRIADGVDFWRKNAAVLLQAQHEYGVPPEIIVAILGVETDYGRILGSYRVLDALATLAFDYPPRAAFFRDELGQFILLSHEEHWDPLTIYGSYAGAIGEPQFMPSSYRHYAIDYNHDNLRNLFNDNADIIGSVANYFKLKGWKTDDPVIVPARLLDPKIDDLANHGVKPNHSMQYWSRLGVMPCQPIAPKYLASLLRMVGNAGPEYYLALRNFYVITLYNTSPHYALAVYQLSQAIAEQYRTSLNNKEA